LQKYCIGFSSPSCTVNLLHRAVLFLRNWQ